MVGIKYTGTDGLTTSFQSTSAIGAIERLSRINGYGGTESDKIAAGLAGGWRERHKARAKKYTGGMPLTGQIGGAKYAHPSGVVSGLNRVSNIEVKNGKLVKTSRAEFVSDGGQVVSVGPKRTETLGSLGDGAANAPANIKASGKVVIRTEYDKNTHELYNIVGRLSVVNGELVITGEEKQIVTTAVQETVAE